MADNTAQFGVEIPPVKGMAEAIKSFDTLTESVTRLGNAVGGLENKLKGVRGIATGTGDMQKMQGAASQLLMTMGPLGQQAALLQQRFSGMGAAIGGLGGMSAGAVVGIGLAVVALLALAAAAMAVKKAFDIMMESIKVASKFQGLSDTFSDFIGDAKAATEQMNKMRDLWHRAGIFKLDELVEAGTRIRSLGGGIEHITELTEAMAKASKAGTGDIKGMTEAFASLMAGRIRGAPSIDQLTLIRAIAVQSKGPMESLDQAVARTTLSIKKHEIATEDMARALIKAGQAGGIFANEIEEEQHMFEGASKMMAQRWEEFMLALGTPIIDALTPIMLRWANTLDQLIPKGKEWGETIGLWITKIDAAVTALDDLITRLEKIPGLMMALKVAIGQIPLIGPVVSMGITGAQIAHNVLTPEPGPGGIPKPAGIDTIKAPGPMPGRLGNWIQTHEPTGGGGESAFEKYKADLQLLSDMWEEYGIIQAKATTKTEAQYRSMQLIEKLIPTLGDPLAHMAELMAGLGPSDAALVKWKILDEVATRALKHIEDKAKANQATMSEVWSAGLKKMSDSWGSFQTQMIDGIGAIGNALVSDISGGLIDILNGTKSVKDGFRDMALAIIKDIEQIVIKMLVQLAIQQMISAFGGAGAGGAAYDTMGGSGASFNISGAGNFVKSQTGGFVPGEGRGDKVHAMLEPGEFVIPKDSAEKIGYGKLEQMRRMADGGQVLRMAEGGYVTGAIHVDSHGNVDSPFHLGQVIFIPGIGEVHLTDTGPGVPYSGVDVAVSTGGQMRSGLVNRTVTINGVATQLTGYVPGNRAVDPSGGGLNDAFGHRVVKLPPGGGHGGRSAGPDFNPFTGRNRPGKPGDPGGTDPGKRIMGVDDQGNPITLDDLSGGGGRFGGDIGDINRGDRPGFPSASINYPWLANTPTGPAGYDLFRGAYDPNTGVGDMNRVGVSAADLGKTWMPSTIRKGYDVLQTPTGDVYRRSDTGGGGGGGGPGGYATDPRGGMHGPGDRMGMGDPYSPGAYNPAGPGLSPGHFGTGFGSGTVSNFYTAIGFGGNLGGSAVVNAAALGGGNWIKAQYANRMMKGHFMSPEVFGLMKHAMPNPFGGESGMGGSYQNYLKNQQQWAGVFQARGYVFGPPQGTGDTGHIQTQTHGHLPPQSKFHEGGIVDGWGEYQSGGTVRRGEGVFTPEQMASLQPSGGGTQVNQITIAINNQGGRTEARAEGSGLNDKDAREMARAMLAVCKAQIEKEKHVGGSLYVPRSGRGG